MKLESYILNDFLNTLNEKKINYCIMNNYTEMPELIPSDVDFAIEKSAFYKLDYLVNELAKKYNVSITQKIWHGYLKCAYILSPIDVKERFCLQLDFFVDFSANGYPNLLKVEDMLRYKRKFKNFYIPKPEIEGAFVLQRRIFKKDISTRHLDYLNKLYLDNISSFVSGIRNIYNDYRAEEILLETITTKNRDKFDENIGYLTKSLNRISRRNTSIRYWLNYYIWQNIRLIYRIIYPTGLSIVVSGQDKEVRKYTINKIDEIINGSFHGTFYYESNPYPSIYKSLKALFFKIKKFKSFQSIQDYSFLKSLITFDDIVININNIDKEKLNDHLIAEFSKKILTLQAKRTKRHLFNKLSHTAKF